MRTSQKDFFSLLLPMVGLVLLLWLPFGFQLTGLVEEWGVLAGFSPSPYFFVNPFTLTPLAAHYVRPFTVLPHALAYLIDPNSFNAWNVLLMISLVMKGWACAYLGYQLLGSRLWSVFLGALVILYPADTMQLSFRSLHINMAEALCLVALALHFASYTKTSLLQRDGLLLTSFLCLATAIFMYEPYIVMVLAILPCLYAKQGLKQGWKCLRQHPAALFSWLSAPFLYVVYLILLFILHPPVIAYQKTIATHEGFRFFIYNHIPKLFSVGLFRSLIGAWYDAIRITFTEFKNYTYFLLIFLLGLACYPVYKQKKMAQTKPAIIRTIIAGLLLILLGYSPFLVALTHLAISQRTFLLTAPGAALIVTIILYRIANFNKWLAISLSLAFIITAFATQLYQLHYYVAFSNVQKQILKNIVENFDGDTSNKKLLILDGSQSLSYTWILHDNLGATLSYLYNKRISGDDISVCFAPENVWLDDKLGRPKNDGKCIEYPNKWVLQHAASSKIREIILPKTHLAIVKINPDYTAEHNKNLSQHQLRLTSAQDPIAQRYQHILVNHPWPFDFGLFASPEKSDHYQLSFGKWWSMDTPAQGIGWFETEWAMGYLHHYSVQWKTLETASILFHLQPQQKNYTLHGEVEPRSDMQLEKQLKISLNQHPLSLHWIGNKEFIASVPNKDLITGMNKFIFSSPLDRNHFSFHLKSMDLVPER